MPTTLRARAIVVTESSPRMSKPDTRVTPIMTRAATIIGTRPTR
jgi:hypothetical protein